MVLPQTDVMQSKTDEEFKTMMIDYIRNNFSDVLGNDINMLDLPNGLELIAQKYSLDVIRETRLAG